MRAVTKASVLSVLAVSTGLFGQTPPALDIVLLVEDSIPATSLVRRLDLSALGPADRVAVMTFAGKQSLKLALDGDPAKVDRAVNKLDSKGTQATTRLWDALAKATGLFDGPRDPSRRRAVFLVFRAADESSAQTVDSVRAALLRSEVSLSATVLYGDQQPLATARIVLTPNRTPAPQRPRVWSERVPVSEGSTLPDLALQAVGELARETGGLVLKDEWSFTKLANQARNR